MVWFTSANASSILFFLFFPLTIKDKTNISLTFKILHLWQSSFTRRVRTIFTLNIIVSIFVKTLFNLSFTLTTIFYRKNFCEKGYRWSKSLLAHFHWPYDKPHYTYILINVYWNMVKYKKTLQMTLLFTPFWRD
jgi:hypothetical protein